jgi:hypothetical protein
VLSLTIDRITRRHGGTMSSLRLDIGSSCHARNNLIPPNSTLW